MADHQQQYDALCQEISEAAKLDGIQQLLEWDERTIMPAKAGTHRAEQVSLLAGLIHERRTSAKVGELLASLRDSPLAEDPHSDMGTTIRVLSREYERDSKLPQALVVELSKAKVLAQQVWVQARSGNNFPLFRPQLDNMLKLMRETADAIGYAESRYDALLDYYEPEAKTSEVAAALTALKDDLAPLVAEIAQSGRHPKMDILKRDYPIALQEEFGKRVAKEIGFDFEAGRLDVTHHPFCCGVGPHDCRITTRYDQNFFPSAFYSTLHEVGHGLYDQGLRSDQFGLPPGLAVSLGLHESQSRMWENMVGRSYPFWRHYYPELKKLFPSLGDTPMGDFHFAVNDVRPSLIRVEADEATYNLHIIIRFELEQALLSGDLPVADLPGAWNEKYQQLLGLSSDDDADGCLQDVHWSAGLIGYFPTYSLGNMYSAQLFDQAAIDLGDLAEMFRHGVFMPLLDWLREKVHQPGSCYPAPQLMQNICGESLDHRPLLKYLRTKYAPLYGIEH
ncbi:carboxypeptidase M32 [Blastopirellula retiformator]|uniref:Metal-dependent carboxypeptidase n=1 Tax=Blastopirellula retiformator TaxID=2527970 RepID=A0A5C5VKB4_9BACT|nr:carboxypeptidase M32 [Blastopirellula retiformator]TWT38501.1 Thermostable carboxypeptidase 1 [Blastopirellula retiformator]